MLEMLIIIPFVCYRTDCRGFGCLSVVVENRIDLSDKFGQSEVTVQVDQDLVRSGVFFH